MAKARSRTTGVADRSAITLAAVTPTPRRRAIPANCSEFGLGGVDAVLGDE